MKKKIVSTIIVLMISSMSILALVACVKDDPAPRKVELELINPTTGEVINDGDRIDLPTEKTYIEVRIKDKETGVYLTDDDLPKNTVKGSYWTEFTVYDDEWMGSQHAVETNWCWPEKVDAFRNHYQVLIQFDCKPRNINGKDYKWKYEQTEKYVRFIINR